MKQRRHVKQKDNVCVRKKKLAYMIVVRPLGTGLRKLVYWAIRWHMGTRIVRRMLNTQSIVVTVGGSSQARTGSLLGLVGGEHPPAFIVVTKNTLGYITPTQHQWFEDKKKIIHLHKK
jgi:hypothetical protein